MRIKSKHSLNYEKKKADAYQEKQQQNFEEPCTIDNLHNNTGVIKTLYEAIERQRAAENKVDNEKYSICFDYTMKLVAFVENFDRFKVHRHGEDIKHIFLVAGDILLKTVDMSKTASDVTDNDKKSIQTCITYLQRVLMVDPFNTVAKDLYTVAHIFMTNFNTDVEENLDLLANVMTVNPCNYKLHFVIAYLYSCINDTENTLQHLKLAIGIIDLELKTVYGGNSAHKDAKILQQLKVHCLSKLSEIYHMSDDDDLTSYYLLEALKVLPDDPDINNQLAITYVSMGKMDKAIQHYKNGIKHVKNAFITQDTNLLLASLYANLGSVYTYEINYKTAIEYFDKSLELEPRVMIPYANKLFNTHYILHTINDPMFLANLHRGINKYYKDMVMHYKESLPNYITKTSIIHWDGKDKMQLIGKTKLRIGFVSGEFMGKFTCPPVSYFLNCILKFINYQLFEIVCYSMKNVDLDDVFPQITWKVVSQNITTQDFKNMIEEDKIDILFDLAGHTGKNRLDTFSLKPAPITINYCGYPNTTGLANMDYRIVDRICDSDGKTPGPNGVVRPSTQKYHTETLLFMDKCFLSYTPFPGINQIPKLAQQPALTNGYLTLGTFNRYNKITDKVVELWQKILQRCPNVKIVLKAKEFCTNYIREQFLNSWKDKNVLERVTILPYSDTYNEHLPDYNKMDIGLDTFPYSGTTTSCESLIMGVPVMTLFDEKRQYHVQNVTSSLMYHSELPEFICLSEEEYIQKIEHYANNLETLRNLKETVRRKFIDNICDYSRFVNEFEDKMLQIYKNHDW